MRLIALQRPDGYLGTYVNPDYVRPLGYDASSYTNTVKKAPWCWNLWCRKYTMWGLLANWRLTGDKKVLKNDGTWGAWTLEIGAGAAAKRMPVCDYPSSGDDFRDGGFRFSIWF